LTASEAYTAARYARAFPEGYAGHFWHQARLRVVLAELAKLEATGVLDIGCGPGQYVKALRARGYDAAGCDLGDAKVEDALTPFVWTNTDVAAVDAATRARIDVGLLLDVLEHLPEPRDLLLRVAAALPVLKALVVTVPARPELWSELDRRAGHCRRFHLDELTRVLDDAGFVVMEATYLFRLLYPAAWLARRRAQPREISAPASPRLHRALGYVLAAEGRVLPRRLPGTSVLCVATPRLAATARPS